MKLYRVLGEKGRVTIPFPLRQQIGFQPGDVVSFELADCSTVIVRQETLLKDAVPFSDVEMPSLQEFLESLSRNEQFAALSFLSALWTEYQRGNKDG